MKRKAFVVVILAVLAISKMFAGPFGIEFGMNENEVLKVSTLDEKGKNGFVWIKPDKKSSLLSLYAVRIAPSTGVFEIRAIGNTIYTSSYGDEIRDEYAKVKNMITKNYGDPTSEYDYLKSGSIWDETRDWMKGIQKNERVYKSYWIKDKGASLPDNMDSISLTIRTFTDDENKAYIVLTYQSSSWDKGNSELSESENVF
jgi:hypothetical protein